MKPTIRVSIGGSAFNLEEEAYQILNNYLVSLQKHFQSYPESEEIISDIEIRLSELLQMSMKSKDSTVSVIDAQETINIMGNPKDFDDNPEIVDNDNNSIKENTNRPEQKEVYRKRLFRDNDNKIIGGVLSGIGHYFNVDPIILRIGVVALIILMNYLSFKGAATILLAYIILWIIMPVAKTFSQKLSMTGADPSIINIEDRSQNGSLKRKSAVRKILGVVINIIAIFIIIVTSITLIGFCISIGWLYLDTEIIAFPNYLLLFGYNTINVKMAIAILILLPFIGLLSLMIKIIRRSPFTSRTIVCCCIGIIFWFGAASYIGSNGFKFAKNHREIAISTETFKLDSINSDTLQIKLIGDTNIVYQQLNNQGMLYRGDEIKDRQIQILPTVRVIKDSTLTEYKIEIQKKAYADELYKAEEKVKTMELNYYRTGSLINLAPEWYDNKNPWDLQTYEILITAPTGKTVIVDSPLKDYYELDKNFAINKKTFRRYDYNRRRHYYFD